MNLRLNEIVETYLSEKNSFVLILTSYPTVIQQQFLTIWKKGIQQKIKINK
jgi:hypothetical protein